MSEFPKHIQALSDYGYAPPPEGHACGQCGISWSDYENRIARLERELEVAIEIGAKNRFLGVAEPFRLSAEHRQKLKSQFQKETREEIVSHFSEPRPVGGEK